MWGWKSAAYGLGGGEHRTEMAEHQQLQSMSPPHHVVAPVLLLWTWGLVFPGADGPLEGSLCQPWPVANPVFIKEGLEGVWALKPGTPEC